MKIFEAALAASGAALIADGPGHQDRAVRGGRRGRQARAHVRRTGPPRTRPVDRGRAAAYVAAGEMERILRSMAPQSVVSRVDSARNLLMLTGSSADIASMVETIRIFDVDWMRGMSFGIFPVETYDADAIAKELDTIFANDTRQPDQRHGPLRAECPSEGHPRHHVAARHT